MEELAVPIQSQFDVRRVIAEVAQKQGVLLEEGDPLFVALEAHAVVLQEVAARLLSEIEEASKHLKTAVPGQVDAAMKASLETAAKAVRQGIDSDIQGASLKARAIVDSVYRSQSRRAIWMWIAVGLLAGSLLFGAGMVVGRAWWDTALTVGR
jgi:hypothetical protein